MWEIEVDGEQESKHERERDVQCVSCTLQMSTVQEYAIFLGIWTVNHHCLLRRLVQNMKVLGY